MHCENLPMRPVDSIRAETGSCSRTITSRRAGMVCLQNGRDCFSFPRAHKSIFMETKSAVCEVRNMSNAGSLEETAGAGNPWKVQRTLVGRAGIESATRPLRAAWRGRADCFDIAFPVESVSGRELHRPARL